MTYSREINIVLKSLNFQEVDATMYIKANTLDGLPNKQKLDLTHE